MTHQFKFTLRAFTALVLLILICDDALSQSYTSPIPWHHTVFEARVAALGQSTAVLSNGSAYHMNPAIPSEEGVLQVSTFLFSTPPFDLPQDGADLYSPAVSYSSGKFTYTAMADYTSFSVPNEFNANSEDYSNRLLRFQAGYKLSENFSLGAGFLHSSYSSPVIVFNNREFGGNATAWGIDLGLFYQNQFINDDFTFKPRLGLSLNNIGPGFDYEANGMSDANLPGQISLGMGFEAVSNRLIYNKPIFGAGIYSGFNKYLPRQELEENGTELSRPGGFEALFTTWNSFERFAGSQNEVISLGDQISNSVGLEFQLLETLFLRYGVLGGADDWVRPQNGFGAEADFYYVSLAVTHLNYHSSDQYGPQDNSTYVQVTFRIPLDGRHRDTILNSLFSR